MPDSPQKLDPPLPTHALPGLWNHPLRPFCIAGPTGSGKSAFAVELAQRWGAEIINVDGYQIYCGLPILTAQPTAEEYAAVPHHLYAVLALDDACNAGRYFRLAVAKILELQTRGVRPLLVGGSGMYLKTLTHGLNELPQADESLRAELETLSREELAARLLVLDPQAAVHVNLLNARHVQRALEICLLTGKPASELKSAWESPVVDGPVGIFLNPNRDILYSRINKRCQHMLVSGALQEVAKMDAISRNAGKAIGVGEIQAFQEGKLAISEVDALISQATRRYAKRQVTWFRNQANLLEQNSLTCHWKDGIEDLERAFPSLRKV